MARRGALRETAQAIAIFTLFVVTAFNATFAQESTRMPLERARTEFRIVPAEHLVQIFARQQIPYTQDLAKKQFAIVYEGLNSTAIATKDPKR